MKKITWLISMVMCLAILAACGRNVGTVNGEKVIKIPTPYADLCLPADFQDEVDSKILSESPYVVRFQTVENGKELFSVSFGKETENLLGTLILDNENIVVYAEFSKFSKEDPNYDQYCAYQDDGINMIIAGLIQDYDFAVNEVVEYIDESTFDIKTDVATLKYPQRWKDLVDIEQTKESIKFSYRENKLFDLYFKEVDGGYLLGTYGETPIYIISHSVDEADFSEDEYYDICWMQEDVNVILEHLMKDKKFVINY